MMTDEERQLLRTTAKLVTRMAADLQSRRNLFLGDSWIAIMAMNWQKDVEQIQDLLDHFNGVDTETAS